MKPTPLHLLALLSNKRASASALALDLGSSQQTVSRWLASLAKDGLAEKAEKGYALTPSGRACLDRIFRSKPPAFSGKLFTGLGEGKYYLSRNGYAKQFRLLGFQPFPGTLNLRLPPEQIAANKALREAKGIVLEGFSEGGRTFGSVKCFPALVNGVKGAVVVPSRLHYAEDVLEVVAPISLRKRLKLKDGDTVSVKPA